MTVFQSRLDTASESFTANRADMLLAHGQAALGVRVVALYKALGGGWESAEPSPATATDSRQEETVR